MAYRAFDEWQPAVAAGPLRVASNLSGQAPSFTPVELKVIALARLDSRGARGSTSRMAHMVARFFGIPRANPLANERLEALRTFAMLAFAGKAREADERNFLASGFSRSALDFLKSSLN